MDKRDSREQEPNNLASSIAAEHLLTTYGMRAAILARLLPFVPRDSILRLALAKTALEKAVKAGEVSEAVQEHAHLIAESKLRLEKEDKPVDSSQTATEQRGSLRQSVNLSDSIQVLLSHHGRASPGAVAAAVTRCSLDPAPLQHASEESAIPASFQLLDLTRLLAWASSMLPGKSSLLLTEQCLEGPAEGTDEFAASGVQEDKDRAGSGNVLSVSSRADWNLTLMAAREGRNMKRRERNQRGVEVPGGRSEEEDEEEEEEEGVPRDHQLNGGSAGVPRVGNMQKKHKQGDDSEKVTKKGKVKEKGTGEAGLQDVEGGETLDSCARRLRRKRQLVQYEEGEEQGTGEEVENRGRTGEKLGGVKSQEEKGGGVVMEEEEDKDKEEDAGEGEGEEQGRRGRRKRALGHPGTKATAQGGSVAKAKEAEQNGHGVWNGGRLRDRGRGTEPRGGRGVIQEEVEENDQGDEEGEDAEQGDDEMGGLGTRKGTTSDGVGEVGVRMQNGTRKKWVQEGMLNKLEGRRGGRVEEEEEGRRGGRRGVPSQEEREEEEALPASRRQTSKEQAFKSRPEAAKPVPPQLIQRKSKSRWGSLFGNDGDQMGCAQNSRQPSAPLPSDPASELGVPGSVPTPGGSRRESVVVSDCCDICRGGPVLGWLFPCRGNCGRMFHDSCAREKKMLLVTNDERTSQHCPWCLLRGKESFEAAINRVLSESDQGIGLEGGGSQRINGAVDNARAAAVDEPPASRRQISEDSKPRRRGQRQSQEEEEDKEEEEKDRGHRRYKKHRDEEHEEGEEEQGNKEDEDGEGLADGEEEWVSKGDKFMRGAEGNGDAGGLSEGEADSGGGRSRSGRTASSRRAASRRGGAGGVPASGEGEEDEIEDTEFQPDLDRSEPLKRRKAKVAYTQAEDEYLIRGMQRFASQADKWKRILAYGRGVFQGRDPISLKDRWRNLQRSQGT